MALGQKSSNALMLIAVSLVLVVFASCPADLWAQRNLPVAVNVKSGYRFDGQMFPVNGYSVQKVAADIGSSCYVVDDGLRRVFISKHHLVNEEPVPTRVPVIEFPIWQDAIEKKADVGILNWANRFNEYGHREINASTPKYTGKTFVQGITKITPTYVELSTLKSAGPKTSLKMSIGTGSVPVDIIRKLLHNQISNSNSPSEYQDIFGYFLQAQQYGEALKELDLIERRFPGSKDQVERDRQKVRQSQARQVLREIKLRVRNGQTDVARGLAGVHMNKEGVASNVLIELQDILDGLNKNESKVKDVRLKVQELVKQYQGSGSPTDQQQTMLGAFLAELESELSPSNVSRLDSYLVQAADATQKDEQKVALAISGWLLGSNNATPNFAVTQSMFTVRNLIRDYLASGNEAQRNAAIEKLKEFEAGTPKFVANMLAQMKPIEHDQALAGYTGEKPIEFTVTVPGTPARPRDEVFRVAVHLPIEYDPYERYPLMLTLPNFSTTVEDQLNMFSSAYVANVGRVGRASRNGVIVASVQWANPGQNVPAYSVREHATVLRAMRACFRKFSVDTDRVFLHGNGNGASLVYDIGLAHPEHFAGLITFGGKIEKYAKVHAKNRNIPLSIYAVMGEGDRVTQEPNVVTWNQWLKSNRYVNLILVEYIGRLGNDSFPDEIESMFEWMEFQRRRLPDPTGFQFTANSLRPWDNYFWFLELHGFPLQNTMWPQLWQDGALKRLVIEGELKPKVDKTCKFVLKPSKAGVGMTLWLAPEFVNFEDGEDEIWISGRGKFRQVVAASTRVILEDVRRRGDRLHPYWAKVDCHNGKWTAAE